MPTCYSVCIVPICSIGPGHRKDACRKRTHKEQSDKEAIVPLTPDCVIKPREVLTRRLLQCKSASISCYVSHLLLSSDNDSMELAQAIYMSLF